MAEHAYAQALVLAQGRATAPRGFDFSRGVLPQGATLARASAGTCRDAAGVLRTMAADIPRFGHRLAGGLWVPAGLIVEPARTNLLLRSSELETGSWSKGNASIAANAEIAPDGTMTADKLVENTSSTSHAASQSITVSANTAHAASVYLKAAERTRALLYYGKSGSPFTRAGALVDLAAGTVSASNSGSPTSVTQRALEAAGNGWWRVLLAGIFDTASTDGLVEVRLHDGSGATYAGNGSSGILLWGAQLERGADASSPIATAGSTGSRAAEAVALDWGSRGVADGGCTVRYTFDDGTTQDVATTVSGGAATVPTTLNRTRILSAQAL